MTLLTFQRHGSLFAERLLLLLLCHFRTLVCKKWIFKRYINQRARDNKEDWMSIWIVENWGRNSRLRVVFLLSFSIHTFLRWKKQLSDFHSPLTLVIYDGAGRSKNFRVCRKKRGRNGKNFTTKESKNFLYYDVSLLCKTTFTTLEKKVSSVRKSRQDIVVITLHCSKEVHSVTTTV